MFPVRTGLKPGDALSPLLFHSALECAIREIQVSHNGLKLNDTHQLLAYADDVNILGRSLLVFASEETGLEVNSIKRST
jgi:hypothetical protein